MEEDRAVGDEDEDDRQRQPGSEPIEESGSTVRPVNIVCESGNGLLGPLAIENGEEQVEQEEETAEGLERNPSTSRKNVYTPLTRATSLYTAIPHTIHGSIVRVTKRSRKERDRNHG